MWAVQKQLNWININVQEKEKKKMYVFIFPCTNHKQCASSPAKSAEDPLLPQL